MIAHAWVVLPTYNEAENLERVLEKIVGVFSGSVLIVDDNSPDGTGQLADRLGRERWPQLQVLHRQKKEGLAAAYRAGLRQVLARGAEIVIHLDADGSHDPQLIPTMVAKLDQADLVLGSRYVPGGRFPIAWYR